MSENSSERAELRRRRDEVAASLAALEEKRTDTTRMNSFARARDRAGVTQRTSDETTRLETDEADAHAAMREARVELHRLDREIESRGRASSVEKLGSVFRRLGRRDG